MVFIRHIDLEVPRGNAIIWRYMGLDKFLDLVTHRRLFFTNARNLTDNYEISLPPNVVNAKRKELEGKGFSGRDLDEKLARFQSSNNPMAELTLVNCWSLGLTESYALWKIYLGGSKAGIAIRTSLTHLKDGIKSVKDPFLENIYIAKVQYRDFLPMKDLSRIRLVATKREFYEYEKELRLFILHDSRSEGGIKTPNDLSLGRYVDVDLELMIDKLYISPFVSPFFEGSIRRVLEKVSPKLEKRLIHSDIRDA